MRKKILLLVMVLFSLLAIANSVSAIVPTEYMVIPANSTVYFDAGTYQFDDPNDWDYTIAVEGDNVYIECNDTVFEFTGTPECCKKGIHTAYYQDYPWGERHNVTIKGCTFKNYWLGIEAPNIENLWIVDNEFYNNWGSGIHIPSWKCLLDNGTWDEIHWPPFESGEPTCEYGWSKDIHVNNNYFAGNPEWIGNVNDWQDRAIGIWFELVEGGEVKNNIFAGNFSVDHLRPDCTSNLLVENNTFKGGGWLIIWQYCWGNNVNDNNTYRNNNFIHEFPSVYEGGTGLYGIGIVQNSQNNTIEGNYFQNLLAGTLEFGSPGGFYYHGVKNNTIKDNVVINGTWSYYTILNLGNSIYINNTADTDADYCWTYFSGFTVCASDWWWFTNVMDIEFSNYNWFENNDWATNNFYDLYIGYAYNNTGCGNIYNESKVYLDGVSPMDNNISTEACPPEVAPPEFNYTLPSELIIHFTDDLNYTIPDCVNCEIWHGRQTGVIFYPRMSCEEVNFECEKYWVWNVTEKIKLITVDNDVCSNFTKLSNCGTPTNWKARGKATWVFHNPYEDENLQHYVSKYSDAFGLTTEFDGRTNKHKIKDDDGIFSESDDVYVADMVMDTNKVTFYIANDNPKTIWADKVYVENHEQFYKISQVDALYTTHGKKNIPIKATLQDQIIIIEPENPKQKIPIESATGSNILEIFYNPSPTGSIIGILYIVVAVGIVLFTVRQGLSGEWTIDKIFAIIIAIIIAIALLGVLVAL